MSSFLSSSYGRAAKHIRSKSNKNNTVSSSNNDFSDSSSSDMPNVTKTSSRSRFTKALPAAPPIFGRLKTSRSSPNTADAAAAQPPLPPLPAASSRFLSEHSYSYVPTSATGAGASGAVLPPRIDSAPWATTAASINSSASSLPYSPQSPQSPQATPFAQRPQPQRPQRPERPETKQLPHSPPPPPPPPQESEQQPQPPVSNFPGLARGAAAESSTAAASGPPIRRRPIAGTNSMASSSSNGTTSPVSSPQPPAADPVYSAPSMPEDRPAFNAFADLPQLPPLSPFNANIPSASEGDAKSEAPSQAQTVRPPSPAAVPNAQDFSTRVTSISSIISAYSHDSFERTGISSSNSDGTASTNNSSYMAASSPLRPLPEETLNRSGDNQRQQKGDDGVPPLSYLLEEEYGDEDGGRLAQRETTAAGPASGQEERDERPVLPVKDGRRDVHGGSNMNDSRAEGNRAAVAPPPPVKDDNVRPAQPTTTLRHPTTANSVAPAATALAAAVAAMSLHSTSKPQDSKTQEGALPPLPSSSSSNTLSPKLWERRSEKTDKPISVPELKLASTAVSPSPAPAATANQATGPAPTNASNGSESVFSRGPLPPPRSPLPPPPSSSRSEQSQPQSTATPPAVGESKGSASQAPLSRIGLPGRNVRPSQQPSPASSPSTSSNNTVPDMGSSVSRLKAKLGRKTNAKEANAAPSAVQRLPTPEYDGVHEQPLQPNGNATAAAAAQGETSSLVASTNSTSATSGSSTTVVNGLASPTGAYPPSNFGLPPSSVSAPYQTKDIDTPRATPPPQTQTREQAQQQFAPRTSSRKAPGYAAAPSASVPASYQDQYGEDADRAVSETGSQLTIKAVASTLSFENEQQQQQQQQQQQPYSDPVYRIDNAKIGSLSNTKNRGALSPGNPPLFPSGYLPNPVTADTVFAAPAPSRPQYQCLQDHKDMYYDRNVHYPLSCQTCQTFERTPRMRCRWCYLRVCVDCRDILFNQAGRDLARLLALLEERGLPAGQPPLSKEMPAPVSVPDDLPSPGLPSPGGKLHHVFSASSMNELPVIREA